MLACKFRFFALPVLTYIKYAALRVMNIRNFRRSLSRMLIQSRSRAERFGRVYPIKPKAFGNGFAGDMAFVNVEAIE
jgi:hypothetical protein